MNLILAMLIAAATAMPRPQDDANAGCPTFCPAVYAAICGTDGKTYDNECQLKTHTCKTGEVIFVDYEGECVDTSGRQKQADSKKVCKDQCDREFRPICASDGQTYNNVCMMEFAACQSGSDTLKKVSDGPCPADEERQGKSAQVEAIEVNDEDTEAPVTSIPVAVTEPPAECKKECLRNFKPVCGSDSKTYHNECLLEFAACENKSDKKIVKVSNGVCPELTGRESSSQPKDAADKKKEEVVKDVVCNSNCARNYKPVCGSDGITYNNDCLLESAACNKKAKIVKTAEGKCKQSRQDDEEQKKEEPKADEDTALTAPAASDRCNANCVRNFKPVCGSDGKTYNNDCLLEFASCKNQNTITKVSEGRCPDKKEISPEAKSDEIKDQCHEFKCTRELKQVCGSDGKTYNNECVLHFEACLENKNVTVARNGSCSGGNVANDDDEAADPQDGASDVIQERSAQEDDKEEQKPTATSACKPFCPLLWKPVCGSDGKTYGNECELTSKACLGKTDVVEAHAGECQVAEETTLEPEPEEDLNPCPNECSDGERPVCGSDGKTYQNLCQLNKEKCRSNKIINLAGKGACKPADAAAEQFNVDKPVEPVVKEEETEEVKPEHNFESCAKFCTLEFAPLCASDGKTYSNGCLLEVENCKAKIRGDQEVTKVHDKSCEDA